MYLYLYNSANKDTLHGKEQENRSGFSERLVRKALQDYFEKEKPEIPKEVLREAVIERTEKGKPFFTGLQAAGQEGTPAVHFSVSHSGDWWGCLMAAESVGFDLEVIREKVNYEKIARRFFTEDECELILTNGADAFFDVWVRKEAYVKYLGSGLAEGLDSFSVVEKGCLPPQVLSGKNRTENHLPCYVRTIEIGNGVKGAYCSGSGNPVKKIYTLEGCNE